jgi:tetratricopeptide (TPR) repeat protein
MAGVPRKAARYYRRSFGGKPKDKELYLLAGVFFEAKCLDQARQAIDEALKLKASLKGWRLLAQIHMQNKNYKEAINAYMAASRLAPKNARLELMAGYCAMQMEDYQQALDHLTQAVARAKPNSKDAKEAKRTMNSIKKYLDAQKDRKSLGLERG